MASDADDATTALIAKLLAEDYARSAQEAGGYDDYEDDYQPTKKKRKSRKRKSTKAKKKRASKSTATAAKGDSAATADIEQSAKKAKTQTTATSSSGTNGSGKTVVKEKRVAPRRWTEEEEKLFLEALELHGRDWQSCVQHLNLSRTVQNFKSHAQKHFIRLYRDGRALPAKVRAACVTFVPHSDHSFLLFRVRSLLQYRYAAL